MKVLFTLDTLRGGGTENSLLHLLPHFSEASQCTVCYFYPPHDLKEAFAKAPCELVFLNLKGSYSFFQGIQQLKKLVTDQKYDIIVTSLYRSGIMSRMVGLLTGVPVIDTMVNDSYGAEKRKEFKGLQVVKFQMVYLLDRITAFVPKMWLSNSKYLARVLGTALGIPQQKIQVLYRGRATSKLVAWQPITTEAGFRFISIGRLFSQKGQVYLLQAFHKFHHHHPDSSLVIYGEGPERKKLEALVVALGLTAVVQLPGHSEKAWEQLYASHCFVLPSLYEGFSGALVEALMSGIPVIASDIPMNQEAIAHNTNGLICSVADSEALYQTMATLYTHYDDAIERGKQARSKALQEYDITKIAAAYEQLLRAVAHK